MASLYKGVIEKWMLAMSAPPGGSLVSKINGHGAWCAFVHHPHDLSATMDHFLSRLRETMWSLILYVVCSMYVVCMCIVYVCMYVVICKIHHCIHIHWCIPMGLGHNDPWVESHMWPQQMWGQRSSRGQWPLVQVLAKRSTVFITVSTYIDVFPWDLDTMILG